MTILKWVLLLMMKLTMIILITIFSLNTLSNDISKQDKNAWNQIGNEDNITIFSKSASDGVLPFKAIGTINRNINTVLSVLKNHQKKHEWAPKLDKVTLHKQLSKTDYIFSEYYKTPWPASDREFLLQGKIKKIDANNYLLLAHSIDKNPCLLYTSPSPRD